MNIAVITGSSSGMGKEFVKQIDKYFNVDAIVVIARRIELLNELQKYTKAEILPLKLDLSKKESFNVYEQFLKDNKYNIKLLINGAGFGKFEEFIKGSKEINYDMVNLNCNAVQMISYISIPYMEKGSIIVNLASMSSIQPVPYINIYASTKAFVLSFSRALNVELRKKGIHVCALTPYWVKTEFFDVANKDNVIKYFNYVYEPEYIVKYCFKMITKKKIKDVICPGKYARMQYRLVKILPHKIVMNIWLKQQRIK